MKKMFNTIPMSSSSIQDLNLANKLLNTAIVHWAKYIKAPTGIQLMVFEEASTWSSSSSGLNESF